MGFELGQFAMQAKGLPFSLYRTHRSLSMQGSYAAVSDIGAHHAAAWLIKVDLLGAFPTFAAKARALITYPRVRLGNDNLGLCKLPWVDVFNPASKDRTDTDIYINPASQEIYAELSRFHKEVNHRFLIRCWTFDVRCSMFVFSIFVFSN